LEFQNLLFIAVVIYLMKYGTDAQKARPKKSSFLGTTGFFARWYVWYWPYGAKAKRYLKEDATFELEEYKSKVSKSWIAFFVCAALYATLELWR
jgi:hypothetical protein